MTLKSDTKFEEKLTLGSKNDMKNLVNFHSTTQKSKNFSSVSFFVQSIGVIFYDFEQRCKIWINPDLVVSKMA